MSGCRKMKLLSKTGLVALLTVAGLVGCKEQKRLYDYVGYKDGAVTYEYRQQGIQDTYNNWSKIQNSVIDGNLDSAKVYVTVIQGNDTIKNKIELGFIYNKNKQ
jgi:hypothetical protein